MWWQKMKWLDSITNSVHVNLSNLQELVKHRGAWHAAVQAVDGHELATEHLTLVTLYE